MPFNLKNLFIGAVLLLFIGVAYAEQTETENEQPQVEDKIIDQKSLKKEESERVKKVFEGIAERNRTAKKSPEWLKEAYSSVRPRKLRDIPKEEYKTYRNYIAGKDVYVIVHPGFYAFFDARAVSPSKDNIGEFPSLNIFERLTFEISPKDLNMRVMKEQERLLRDFLEYMSTENKLVILVLPRDYKDHVSYGYAGLDEYARYINEMTNMSGSILYLESQTHNNGVIEKEDLDILTSFLNEIGVKRVLLGGGYLGKCIDDFYESIRKTFKYEDVYFVTEISAISPNDMVSDSINLLTKSGRINFRGVRKYLKVNGIATDNPDEKPKFRRLTLYKVYR